MTLTELKYIVTLSRTLHFGEAAKRCFVSQPTLSVAVKKLEDELGITIFERHRNALMVTTVGQKIIAQAKEVLAQATVIDQIVENDKDPLASTIRLGAILTVGPYLFPKLIPSIKNLAPNMPFYIEEDYTANLRHKLLAGELDAVVVATPFSATDVVVKKLYDESFVVLLPHGHTLEKKASINHKDLLDETLLLLGEGHCFRDQVLEACPSIRQTLDKNNDTSKMIAEGSSLETIKYMVATNLGVTLLPLSAVTSDIQHSSELTVRPFSQPAPKRSIALAWRASFPRSKVIDLLSTSIASMRNDLDSLQKQLSK